MQYHIKIESEFDYLVTTQAIEGLGFSQTDLPYGDFKSGQWLFVDTHTRGFNVETPQNKAYLGSTQFLSRLFTHHFRKTIFGKYKFKK